MAPIRLTLSQHILREPSGCQGQAPRHNSGQNRRCCPPPVHFLQGVSGFCSFRVVQAEETAHAKGLKCKYCQHRACGQ